MPHSVIIERKANEEIETIESSKVININLLFLKISRTSLKKEIYQLEIKFLYLRCDISWGKVHKYSQFQKI